MNRSRRSDSSPDASGSSGESSVEQVVEHLFRREFGRLVAMLTHRFGVRHLQLAEDVVQDALLRAMETWPFTGVPRNPTAWLLQTAKHRALDQTRRGQRWREMGDRLGAMMDDFLQSAEALPDARFEGDIRDSRLRMMFVCCHPALPPEAQVALTLRTLCGLGEREIAAAFLVSCDAIAKRLVRARQQLREQGIELDLPEPSQLRSRLGGVQQTLYLLFNEGYKASEGDSLLRADLCAEAIRLGEMLAGDSIGAQPSTHALLALMDFNAARLSTRMDETGNLLLLGEQDRTRWDRTLMRRGLDHLSASGEGDKVSRFHLEAGIAACHTLAPSDAATDWTKILELYDALLALDGSPVVSLNRAVALARVRGPVAGLQAIEMMPHRRTLENHHLLYAVSGQLWFDAGDTARAASNFRQAVTRAAVETEKDFLRRRLADAESRSAGDSVQR